MTAPTSTPVTTAARGVLIPRGLGMLTRTEGRLFSRDAGSVFFALVFPSLLLVGMGFAIPGLREPVEGMGAIWDGLLVIHVFAPAIGNAHGMYTATPTLDNQRVTEIVEATGIPVALHGGTGMSAEQFADLIARGCAKVNISTALKIRFMASGYDYMTAHPGKYDPPSLFAVQREAVKAMAAEHIEMFGSAGRAW